MYLIIYLIRYLSNNFRKAITKVWLYIFLVYIKCLNLYIYKYKINIMFIKYSIVFFKKLIILS